MQLLHKNDMHTYIHTNLYSTKNRENESEVLVHNQHWHLRHLTYLFYYDFV